MRVAIYQPRYFPQLHYFNRIVDSHTFVILDCAQYTKSLSQETTDGKKRTTSYQSDTPIKLSQGTFLLTIPIKHDGYRALHDTHVDYSHKWHTKHLAIIKSAYKKSPYFSNMYEEIAILLSKEYSSLAALNITTILWGLYKLFDLPFLETPTVKTLNTYLHQSSYLLQNVIIGHDIGIPRPEGLQKGTEWTTAICKKLGATEYLHGKTAQTNYMNLDYYHQHGIQPVAQDWVCSVYPQQFSTYPFIPNLSILDLFFNVDTQQARKIIGITT